MKTNTSTRLKEIMRIKGLKQIDILERCEHNPYGGKISKSDLSQYVSGKVLPRQDKLSILAYALDVSEAWLMGYNVPMKIQDNSTEIDTIKQNLISNITLLINDFNIDTLNELYDLLNLVKNFNKEDLNQIKKYIMFIKSQKEE